MGKPLYCWYSELLEPRSTIESYYTKQDDWSARGCHSVQASALPRPAAPSVELTLAKGIVSSKRTADGDRLVQTTAPISPRSSGGGLFDAQANPIAITTFMLKQS
jgi:S1-C subfamily serine protease